ncbi:MAG: hypothetical protein HC827_12205 [Cyanobacteria bacterium RM1_2_2]|nr:hypothetical protein [Cyanobacteria bacterium RM1_2_2]
MFDFEDYSLTQPAVLVTILTEAILKDSIEKLLKNLKVFGYSISETPGAVKRIQQFGQIATVQTAATEANTDQVESYAATRLEIRAVVSPELSNVILIALKEQQRQFAVLVYRQKVEALVE